LSRILRIIVIVQSLDVLLFNCIVDRLWLELSYLLVHLVQLFDIFDDLERISDKRGSHIAFVKTNEMTMESCKLARDPRIHEL